MCIPSSWMLRMRRDGAPELIWGVTKPEPKTG
jgi:hypothetical protein